MATNQNNARKKIEQARSQILKVLSQAKDSLKVLQEIEKETIARARSWVPDLEEQKKQTNAKILSGLKKMGVATQDEVQALSAKVKSLEGSLKASKTKSARSSTKAL